METTKPSLPEQAVRFNESKPLITLMSIKSHEQMIRVLEFGAQKYSRDNWKKGMPTSEIIDSAGRHFAAMLEGDFLDPESGLPHYAHIQCNMMFLDWMIRNKPELDNFFNTKNDEYS